MSNSQEENKTSVVDIGERLRQAREKRGLTLEQAQKQTHIHSTVLLAIEEGRCDEMLTPNYVKSFLKEYSNFLGFDHQKIVNEYLTLHPELKTKNLNLGLGSPISRPYMDLSKMIRVTRSLLIFLAVVFLGIFLSSKTADFFKHMKVVKKPQALKTSGKIKPAPRQTSGSQKVSTPRKSILAKNVPFTLTLKIKNPVMVQIKKDGVLLFKRVLPKGIEETFAVKNSANIFIGRAESVEIIVDGKSLGVPGKGVIRNLEVTSNGVRIK